MIRRFLFLIPSVFLTSLPASGASPAAPAVHVADEAGFQKNAVPFLEAHCAKCHSGEKVKGHFDLKLQATNAFDQNATAVQWKKILEVVRNDEMPPKKEPRPDVAGSEAFTGWIEQEMRRGERSRKPAALTIRRLNRILYNNTMQDLLAIDYRPADDFPADAEAGGFDNISAALSLSPLQLDLYTTAAAAALDRAIFTGPQPDMIHWHLEPEADVEGSDRTRVKLDGQNVLLNAGENRKEEGQVRIHHESWNTGVGFRDFKAPAPGNYRLKIRAASRIPDRAAVVASAAKILAQRRDEEITKNPANRKNAENQYRDDLGHFQTDRMYDYGPARLNVVLSLGGQPTPVATLDIPAAPDAPAVYEIPLRLDTQSAGIQISYAYSIPQVLDNFWMQSKPEFARPELWIDWLELEGPLHPVWPPASHTRLLPPSPLAASDPRAYARLVLERFMPLAWRRPVTEEELVRKLALFDKSYAATPVMEEAIRLPLIAVLSSPSFLFQIETSAPGTPLSAWELAVRLPFFLWSAPPDATLRALAECGKLLEPATLHAEVERLLADPRAVALTEGFADQWLDLRKVGANPPAPALYPQYDRHLETSMVGETRSFFSEILQHDRPVASFLKSDFLTVNERLARFYGIDGVRGDQFRTIPLPPGSPRGGLVTQAAMLTTTSNGTRTSPVHRGVWLLKTLLDQDPRIPPANVGEVPPKVPGIDKATVRQRLEIHRTLPQCARCHSKIDPLGLSLENFNAAGEWREREGFGYNGRIEKEDPLINATATLPDGTALEGSRSLQNYLLTRQDDFLRCLQEKLTTYALGREMTLADEPALRGMLAAWQQSGLTLRQLIHTITASPLFLRK